MLQAPSLASRRLLACIACALGIVAFATMGTRTVAAGVAVVVNGRPLYLNPGPLERAGRVFVPLRGIFERLGASVVYENRQINSTKGSTSVSLRIGSAQAMVNGQPQMLDVAPFIVGATTYVPLRFVAQSLGAVVNYNGATRLVAITVPRPQLTSGPPMPPNPPPVSIVQLRTRQPAPGTLTGNRFTLIEAQFSHAVDADSVRVWLDGNDITVRSGVSSGGFSYKPPAPLDFGAHNVRVAGLDRSGLRFTHSWSFTTTRVAPPESPVQLRNQEPSPSATVDNRQAAIAAKFAPQANAASVRVRLDGIDITPFSGVWQGGFSYKPPTPLDFGTHTVRVSGCGLGGSAFDRSWSFTTTRVAPPENPVQLRNQEPSPGATLDNRFALVAANFTPQADAASVRVRLDGNDITSRSGVSPSGFSYKPPAPLDFGTHTVRVSGRARGALAFDHSWSFTTARSPTPPASPTPEPVRLRDQQPSPEATLHDRFALVAANFTPQADAASVRVRLDGNDITSRSGVSPSGFSYKPPAPLDFGKHTVRVTGRGRGGLEFDHSWPFTLRRSLQPIVVPSTTPTQAPAPAPTRSPRIVPTAAPTLAPTAAPTLAPTPTPTRTPRIVPTATPTLAPTAAPTLAPTAASTPAPTPTPTRAARKVVPTPAPTPAPTATPIQQGY